MDEKPTKIIEMEFRAKLAKKVSKVAHAIGKLAKDGENKHSSFKFISYENIEGALRSIEEEQGIQIYPEIESFSEEGFKTSKGVAGTRTIIVMSFAVTDTETGFQEVKRWAGADQDTGGKSMAQAITEACKRFKTKLYKISAQGEVDPDSNTTEGGKKTESAGDKRITAQNTKTREMPEHEVWTKANEVKKAVGNEIWERGKAEAEKKEIWTITDMKAVLLAVDMVANKIDSEVIDEN